MEKKRNELGMLALTTTVGVTLGMFGYAGVMGDFNAAAVQSILIG